MLALSCEDLRALVPMPDAIAAVRQAFASLSAGRAVIPVRASVGVPGTDAVLLAMSGALERPASAETSPQAAGQAPVLGAKLVSVFPRNQMSGAPVVQAVVVVFEGTSGRPLALIEGASLTALRTGAATGVATDLLALPDAGILALFGAGAQARRQLEAVCAVRRVTQVRVVDPAPGRAEAFCAWARGQAWVGGATLLAVDDPELAVRGAEIVVTVTTSPTPVFPGRAVAPGTHVNALGAFHPTTREVDSDLIGKASVFVDSHAGVLEEAGDLLIPIREGRFSAADIRAEIGEVAAGRAGRRTGEEVTLFKSVGNAVQDLAVAGLAVERAGSSNRGARIVLDAEDG